MDSAFAWIQQLTEWLGRFVPRWVVLESTQAAVKFVYGRTIVTQREGVVWWWPVVTSISVYPVARQAHDLRAQTIVTKDDKCYAVGGLIVYEIADVEKIVAHTYDPDDTIRDVALTAIHDACIQHDSTSLMDAARSGKLDREMRAEAKKQLDAYGVRVIRMTLTDLAPCRVLRIVGGGATDNALTKALAV